MCKISAIIFQCQLGLQFQTILYSKSQVETEVPKCKGTRSLLIIPNLPDLLLEWPEAQSSAIFLPPYMHFLSDLIQSQGFKFHLYADNLKFITPAWNFPLNSIFIYLPACSTSSLRCPQKIANITSKTMALGCSPLLAGVLILVNGKSIFSVDLIPTMKSLCDPFFLLYPTNVPETLVLLQNPKLNPSHLSAPPLLPLWFSPWTAPGWIIAVACYLASLIDYLGSGFQSSSQSDHFPSLLQSLLWFSISLRLERSLHNYLYGLTSFALLCALLCSCCLDHRTPVAGALRVGHFGAFAPECSLLLLQSHPFLLPLVLHSSENFPGHLI